MRKLQRLCEAEKDTAERGKLYVDLVRLTRTPPRQKGFMLTL